MPAEDRGQAIESGAYAHKPSLLVFVESEHVEAVGSDVVGGTREGHHPKEEQRSLQPERGGDGEGDPSEGRSDEQFHRHNPPSLGADEVDKGAPQRFNDPRQVEPRGIKGDLGIAQTELFVENEGDGHHSHIGQSLRKIEGRNPPPRCFCSHSFLLIALPRLAPSWKASHGDGLVIDRFLGFQRLGSNARGCRYRHSPARPSRRLLSGRDPRHGPTLPRE